MKWKLISGSLFVFIYFCLDIVIRIKYLTAICYFEPIQSIHKMTNCQLSDWIMPALRLNGTDSWCACFNIYIIVFVSYVLVSNISMINICGMFLGVHYNSAAHGQLGAHFFLLWKIIMFPKTKQLILKNLCFKFVCNYSPIYFICHWIVYTRK